MAVPDDPTTWSKVAAWAAGGAAALAGMVWGDMRMRVTKLEDSLSKRAEKEHVQELAEVISKKADKDELNRQRDNINDLFTKLDDHNRDVTKKFDTMTALIHELHRQVMDKLDKKQDKRR